MSELNKEEIEAMDLDFTAFLPDATLIFTDIDVTSNANISSRLGPISTLFIGDDPILFIELTLPDSTEVYIMVK